jgi:hypothetical protein
VLGKNGDGTFTVARTLVYGGPGNGTWKVRRFPAGDKHSRFDQTRSWIAAIGEEAFVDARADEDRPRYNR